MKCNTIYRAKETNVLIHQQRKNSLIISTSVLKSNQEKQQENLINCSMTKNFDGIHINLQETPLLLRSYTINTTNKSNKQFLFNHITL